MPANFDLCKNILNFIGNEVIVHLVEIRFRYRANIKVLVNSIKAKLKWSFQAAPKFPDERHLPLKNWPKSLFKTPIYSAEIKETIFPVHNSANI